ncbi:methylmalonic aciduria protein, putative [Pediculus humanus corporis]|uniref:Methylmalonic aciduria protein, putative n=1 Tax=Pediculus humanus subsp. corporis TaxID=121224 RepID=E0VLQ5_PEDHC|nr:methylmalonic aciduria protein, putative [Pediculus humanus corporis]EEB14311.1 methylmalonic aciduria protein, putative [Pediculus humanus corporis]
MSTIIFNNSFYKNLITPKYIYLHYIHRSIDKYAVSTKVADNGKNKIKTGDLRKNHIICEAIGVTEELSACIGLAREYVLEDEKLRPVAEKLRKIQLVLIDAVEIINRLQAKESRLDSSKIPELTKSAEITCGDIADLEALIAHYGTFLPQIEKVLVPGGGKASAALHVARASCRRCERVLISVFKDADNGKNILAYINRLSSYLFQAARISAKFANRPESIYKPHT